MLRRLRREFLSAGRGWDAGWRGELLSRGGPEFGSAVVAHPQTRFIAFTGSKEVGLEIHERAAKTQPGQHFIKRTILEMGGKDSIIVDADADLDAAVEGVAARRLASTGRSARRVRA